MKKLIFTLLISCFTFVGYANHEAASLQSPKGLNPSDFPAEIMNMDMDDFLSLTPKKYKEITGEKLGVQNTLKLKAAQKKKKKQQKPTKQKKNKQTKINISHKIQKNNKNLKNYDICQKNKYLFFYYFVFFFF
ncbi:MAG: hypothetical protein KDD63_06970, partial [Bacteroidetes bacterium]|nr:hypothetical protein [Bacteroidota bacterium]